MGSFTQLTYHVVFATKYRKPWIREHVREELYRYIGGIFRDKKGSILEIGGVADHVHILARRSPTLAVADVIREVKGSSSKWLHEQDDSHRGFEWQKGYGAFTVSYDRAKTVSNYIRNQEEHHRKMSFQEEYESFLQRHGVEYRVEYLFEDEHHGCRAGG